MKTCFLKPRAVAVLFCLALAGCVTVPPPSQDGGTSREELAAHVRFLSQPALKGRKPRTTGSRLSRQYIEARFKAYGLVPWGQRTGYERSFGFGRNVVGVLPGADAELAREMVLLCAHYDHLGKDKGKSYPGAADNASGVAVLLETARQMSRLGQRPRRSVAFIAFDCEEQMLLGSFAFSCQEDVQRTNIAAVVNVDMLGRDFMDVVRDTVFVTGTEEYPTLREQVCRFGAAAGLRLLPIGTDLIGPRGDHAAFESLGVPCLFFTCGIFRDYHKPTDTPEKLNLAGIDRSAKVILQTVEALADAESIQRVASTGNCDLEELHTVTTVLTEVLRSAEEAGLKEDDAAAFQRLERQAEVVLQSGRYDRRTRNELVMAATGTLVPYLEPMGHPGKPPNAEQEQEWTAGMQLMQHFYVNYRNAMLEGFRGLVAQLLKYRPGPCRGMPKFEFEVYDIADDDIRLTEAGPSAYALDALANEFAISMEVKRSKWLVNSLAGALTCGLVAMHCEGTREQLADYCLLLRSEPNSTTRSNSLGKLSRALSGTAGAGSYRELLAARLACGRLQDETDWMAHCILTGTPWLARQALQAARDNPDPRLRDAGCLVLTDRNRRPDVRAAAVELVAKRRDKQGLLALCSVLEDVSPVHQPEYDPIRRQGFPFAERMEIKTVRSLIEKQLEKSPYASQTIGDLARAELKKASRADFGKDAARWRSWVQAHVK